MSNSPVSKEIVNADRTPRAVEKVEGSFDKYPSWRFSRADFEHEEWSVLGIYEKDIIEDPSDPTGSKILYQPSESIDKTLLDSLKGREKMTWRDLMLQTGGPSKGTNSHYIPIRNLEKEAQKRAVELNIVEDELFSLRLDGKHRVFGILVEGVMTIIWFDRDHKVCRSTRR